MQAPDFTNKWIALEDDVEDFANDPAIPVMVINNRTGNIFSIKNLRIERHEGAGYTVWIEVEDY